jgi:hypothetical protein
MGPPFVIKELPKENNCPIGENSTKLVTLLEHLFPSYLRATLLYSLQQGALMLYVKNRPTHILRMRNFFL